MTAGAGERPAATRIGVALPTNRRRMDAADLRRILSALEAGACHSVWVNDHLAAFPPAAERYPYHPSRRIDWDPRTPQYEALSVCAFAAAATRRMRIGTAVLVLPQRHPIEVSKTAATLADLSDGRFVLGVGAGWSRREMALLGWDPANRGVRLDEELALLKASWSPEGDPAALDLRHYEIPDDLILEPRPRAGQIPPLLIGGVSAAALRRVGRYGDGWLAVSGTDPRQLDGLSETLAALRSSVDRTLHAVVKVALPAPEPALAVRICQRIAAHGWQEVCLEFATWSLDDVCEVVEACAAVLGEVVHA